MTTEVSTLFKPAKDVTHSIPLKRALMKAYIMRKDLAVAVAVIGILAAVALPLRAEDNAGTLAKALPERNCSGTLAIFSHPAFQRSLC
jgi:hypothetical protein